MASEALTAERLRSLLDYDQSTGVFTRKVRTARCMKVGDVAGSVNSNGYVTVMVDGRSYKAHRLAWLHVIGKWPSGQIDHINCSRADNSFANLRDVDRSTNIQNQRKAHRGTLTGVLGVTMDRRGTAKRPFMAQIVVAGKRRGLGNHATAEQAHAAYLAAKRELHQGNTL